MRHKAIGICACLLLMGCETTRTPEPVIQIREVKVPVPVACKPDLGAEPVYPDTAAELAKVPYPKDPTLPQQVLNLGDQVKKLLKGRVLRIQRATEYQAAIKGCANISN